MLLRGSGERRGRAYDLLAVTRGEHADSGVHGGRELVAFSEAAVVGRVEEIASARDGVRRVLGEEAVVDAAAVVGNFERMVRIADGTGIPLDRPVAMLTADMRAEIGIDAFASAANTPPVTGLQRVVGRLLRRMVPVVLRVMGIRRRTSP